MSLSRMVSAHAYPGETKQVLLAAVARHDSFDVIVTDPLVLGVGAFDIQDLDDTITLKVTDHTKRQWMVFLERSSAGIVAREE